MVCVCVRVRAHVHARARAQPERSLFTKATYTISSKTV